MNSSAFKSGGMRVGLGWILGLLLAGCSGVAPSPAASKIIKVLPQFVDQEGQTTLSPSLYERDAYQAMLRQNPEKTSGLRFDVNWKVKPRPAGALKLRMELRTSGRDVSEPLVLERQVEPARFFSTWSLVRVPEGEYRSLGQLIAWRASLWDGEVLVAEEKSFLW
jgi:hypothetical protein